MEVTGVTSDSRKVTDSCVFVCIEGTAADGHEYAQAAVDAGAGVVVCQRDLGLENQVIVGDTHLAYASLCAAFFGNPSEKLTLVGVTGTNGKTTTTYLLKSILEHAGKKVGLIGTIQNMIGSAVVEASHTTPDAFELQRLFRDMAEQGCEYVVMEVSSHALHQRRVAGCRFKAALFTNLTQDHLDYHGTMEEYLKAKKILFTMCETGIFNIDDSYAAQMMEGLACEKLTYSIRTDGCDYTAKNIKNRADGVAFELVGNGVIGRVKLPIPGKFSVYNALGAAVTAMALGFPFVTVVEALCAGKGVKGRVEVVPTGRDFTVVIDYAHTPDGLENVLSTMKEVCAGRLIALFGCGGDRDKTKRPLMGRTAAKYADELIITSDNPRSENPMAIIGDILEGLKDSGTPAKVIENRQEAIAYAVSHAGTDDVIVLCGKGHETYQILNNSTIHLDEREVVAQALAQESPGERNPLYELDRTGNCCPAGRDK